MPAYAERPVKLESKRSSFAFAPIWKSWQVEGIFTSLKDAERDVNDRTRFVPGCGEIFIRSKAVKLDGTVRVILEMMPAFGAEETEKWKRYHEGFFRDYTHFRIRPLSTKELNEWLIDSVDNREYENVKLALASGAVVSETARDHIISSWALAEVKILLAEAKKKS